MIVTDSQVQAALSAYLTADDHLSALDAMRAALEAAAQATPDTMREALEVFVNWHKTHPDATLPRGLEHADFTLARAALEAAAQTAPAPKEGE